jgi:hypothetical protein
MGEGLGKGLAFHFRHTPRESLRGGMRPLSASKGGVPFFHPFPKAPIGERPGMTFFKEPKAAESFVPTFRTCL